METRFRYQHAEDSWHGPYRLTNDSLTSSLLLGRRPPNHREAELPRVREGSEAAVRTFAVELVDDMLHRVIATMPLETGFSERRWQIDATQAKVEVVPVLPLRPAHKRVLTLPDELVVTPDKLREQTWSVILTSVCED